MQGHTQQSLCSMSITCSRAAGQTLASQLVTTNHLKPCNGLWLHHSPSHPQQQDVKRNGSAAKCCVPSHAASNSLSLTPQSLAISRLHRRRSGWRPRRPALSRRQQQQRSEQWPPQTWPAWALAVGEGLQVYFQLSSSQVHAGNPTSGLRSVIPDLYKPEPKPFPLPTVSS